MKLSEHPELEAAIDARVELWHSTPRVDLLHNFLGLSFDDYGVYVMRNEVPDNYELPPTP